MLHDARGRPTVNATRFPNMSAMVQHGHSLGLEVGWYENGCKCAEKQDKPLNYRGDIASLHAFRFDGVKMDDCGAQKNMTMYAEIMVASGKNFSIENHKKPEHKNCGLRAASVFSLKELKAAGIDLQTLLDWSSPGRCRLFMRAQMARARKYYIASSRLEEMIAPDCRSTSRAMNDIYHGLLGKIAKNPRQAVGMKRIQLGSLRKMTIAMRARFLARSGCRK